MLHNLLTKTAENIPNHKAIIYKGRDISYNELIKKIYTLSDMLIVEGLRKGDRVIILLSDPLDYITACYAAQRAGCNTLPIFDARKHLNLKAVIQEFSPQLIISSREELLLEPLFLDSISYPIFYIENTTLSQLRQDSHISIQEFMENDNKIRVLLNLDEESGSFIFKNESDSYLRVYSEESIKNISIILNKISVLDSNSTVLFLHSLDEITGLLVMSHVLTSGATMIVGDRDNPDISVLLKSDMLNVLSSNVETFKDLIQKVKYIDLVSQFSTVELYGNIFKTFEQKKYSVLFSKMDFHLFYSTFDAPLCAHITLKTEGKKQDVMGTILPGLDISIKSNGSHSKQRKLTGEIMVNGANTMKGYWHRGRILKDSFTEDGWLNTGDVGYLDKNDCIHLLGTKDSFIDTGTGVISCVEIEEKILEAFPGLEVCVLGVPHSELADVEIPVLCYVANNGKTISPSELSILLLGKYNQNHIPIIVLRRDKFPKSSNTALRKELRKNIIEEMKHTEIRIA
jgi:long-chain acyl-CoA synthetase